MVLVGQNNRVLGAAAVDDDDEEEKEEEKVQASSLPVQMNQPGLLDEQDINKRSESNVFLENPFGLNEEIQKF